MAVALGMLVEDTGRSEMGGRREVLEVEATIEHSFEELGFGEREKGEGGSHCGIGQNTNREEEGSLALHERMLCT